MTKLERPGDPRFHYELASLGDLHDKKQIDYGTDNDPFANVRGSQDWGIPPWVGAMVRANDKVKRLQNFARKGSLANESAEDSFDDLAVYAIIGKVLYREASNFDYETLILDSSIGNFPEHVPGVTALLDGD